MRSILLHIDDDPCLEARLQVALDLARGFDGHVTCLQVSPFEYGVPGDIFGSAAMLINPMFKEQAERLRHKLEERLAGEDVAWNWVESDGWPPTHLVRAAAIHDVVVMGACATRGEAKGYSSLAAEVAIGARTPVLLVPESARSFDITAPAVIAWNASIEASNALRSALPLLQKAASVHVVIVKDEDDHNELPRLGAAEYLARHGIESGIVELPPTSGGACPTLVHAAHARNAGYVVMGAYGHTRLRERILGGVTRALMTSPDWPLLLAH